MHQSLIERAHEILRFFLIFNFEIIYSQGVAKIVQEILCILYTVFPDFTLISESYVTIVQYETGKLTLEQLVCIVLCHFSTCIDSGNHHHDQDTEQCHHHKDLPQVTPLKSHSQGNADFIKWIWKYPLSCSGGKKCVEMMLILL